MTEQRDSEKKRQSPTTPVKNSNKKRNQYLLIGMGLLFLVYAGMAVFFSSHFFFRTEINGFSCQLKTVDQVKTLMKQNCDDFWLVLEERGEKEEIITSDQVQLQFVDDGKVEELMASQNGFAWIGALFKKPVYDRAVTIIYDETAFDNTITELDCMDLESMIAPEAAYPAYDEEKGEFLIVKEVLGTTIEEETFRKAVANALLSDQRKLNLSDAGCYTEPKFYSEDQAITDARDLMNQYMATEITYDFGYRQEKVDKSKMHEWLTTDENANVVVVREKVGDFVQWLANNYNTCGVPRKFSTPEGTTVTVRGGNYGWRIDHNKEVDQLMELVKSGETMTRTPEYKQTGGERDASGNDLPDTYIAISIGAQTMWYFENGTLKLTTPVVTGNVTKKMGTPTGVYYIAFKQRDHVLRGEDYESPVDYWMPFYPYKGVGIHDASWRAADAFGGQIYLTNGSHGCVNTPYNAVKTLFEIVETGTAVIVYE